MEVIFVYIRSLRVTANADNNNYYVVMTSRVIVLVEK